MEHMNPCRFCGSADIAVIDDNGAGFAVVHCTDCPAMLEDNVRSLGKLKEIWNSEPIKTSTDRAGGEIKNIWREPYIEADKLANRPREPYALSLSDAISIYIALSDTYERLDCGTHHIKQCLNQMDRDFNFKSMVQKTDIIK